MQRDSFLALATIVAAVFGLAFLIAPGQLTALYGVTLTPATEVLGRIAGSTILAFAIVYWGARNGAGAQAWKAAMVAGLVTNGLDWPDHAARGGDRPGQCVRLGERRDQRPAGARVCLVHVRQAVRAIFCRRQLQRLRE